MVRGRRARRVTGFLTALTVASLVAVGGTEGRAAADDDGLRFESHTVYRLDTTADVVRVAVDVAVTNEVPSSGSTYYFFSSIRLYVPIEATEVRAVRSDGRGLPIGIEPSEVRWWNRVTIDLEPSLLYRQTQRLQISYVLPSLPPRSEGLTRINDAFATFAVFGHGDPGLASVEVVVPNGLNVEIAGGEMERTVRGTEVVYSAPAIADPAAWNASVVARDESRLVEIDVIAAGRPVEIRAWPGDRQWADFVNQQLQRGLPALESMVGQPWPDSFSDLQITESVAPFAYGYAGWYEPSRNSIEIGDELDSAVIFHELAHVWFNDGLFSVRWINEGFADEFASRVLAELGQPPGAPDPIRTDHPGAQPLNSWSQPDLLDDASQNDEAYGYNASWSVVRLFVDEIGMEAMALVIDAAADRDIPYQGDPDTERMAGANDWRRFLDLLEEIGGSQRAAAVFSSHVLDPDQLPLLAERDTARAAYEPLEAEGDGWTPPLTLRYAMAGWRFDLAADQMVVAHDILEVRQRIETTVGPLGVEVPLALEEAYESEPDDLADVVDLAADTLGAAEELAEAGETVDGDRGILETVGLWFSPVDDDMAAAEAAFEAGDPPGTIQLAGEAVDAVDGAATAGGRRVAIATAALLLLFVLVGVHQRARRRPRAVS